MTRALVLALSLLALAGCRTEVEVSQEGLSAYELEQAYDRCIDNHTHDVDAQGERIYHEADFTKRLACTQAVYGGGR